jgi:DNA-binding NarL/FixJ family response regulator
MAGGTTEESKTTVLICEDHRVVADALGTIVGLESDLELVSAPTADPEEAISISAESHPDVVLMDIELGAAINGLEATRRIKQLSPASNVVILTAHDADAKLIEALEAGAVGFLHKSEAIEGVIDAVRQAAEGNLLIDPSRLPGLLHRIARERAAKRDEQLLVAQLTVREREILQLLARGQRIESIARELHISPHTVQTHVRNILAKLGAHSKLEAVAIGMRAGAIQVNDRF